MIFTAAAIAGSLIVEPVARYRWALALRRRRSAAARGTPAEL